MKPERWKPIVGYKKLYEISNHGRIRSKLGGRCRLPSGSILSLKIGRCNGKQWYYMVGLRKDNIKRTYRVHRLVGKYFVKNPLNKPCINHNDGNKLNNYYENLDWCTVKENTIHAVANKLIHPPRGEASKQAKITSVIALEIFNSKETYVNIAAKYGLYPATVGSIKVGKTWVHVTGKVYKRRRR